MKIQLGSFLGIAPPHYTPQQQRDFYLFERVCKRDSYTKNGYVYKGKMSSLSLERLSLNVRTPLTYYQKQMLEEIYQTNSSKSIESIPLNYNTFIHKLHYESFIKLKELGLIISQNESFNETYTAILSIGNFQLHSEKELLKVSGFDRIKEIGSLIKDINERQQKKSRRKNGHNLRKLQLRELEQLLVLHNQGEIIA